MFYLSRQQRGRHATNACTNCRKKHAKCSEEAICTNCASHNLECIYVKPVKKRGPKATDRSANVFEDNSGDAPNIELEHSSTQFGVPIPFYLDYNEESQPIQYNYFSHINTNDIMLDNSGEAPNIEQEHLSTQFSVPILFYPGYSCNEEFQPIQNGFFSKINTNDIMLDNSGEAPNIEQKHALTQFSVYNDEIQPMQNGFFSKVNTNYIMLDNSGEASNIEQEHALTQYDVPLSFCPGYNYNENFQPIQNGCFSHINTNDIMLNNNALVNFFDNTYSLPNSLSTCSSSIASNLDCMLRKF
ncbi:9039_t:CDS:1 [Racocetra persica]|uniref:9039_t:CDS:1 n=1 Tax=Racocetra persica TaxID=160502 RepID=A0ACA9L9R1_9GLOM|nr:9039_t:CDS:1 [Racocetra persica]